MSDDIVELKAEIGRLRAQLDAVERQLAEPSRSAAATSPSATRRGLIGLAAGVTGATLLGAKPVAAANGDNVVIGQVNESTETTEIKYPLSLGTARPRTHVLAVQDGSWSTPAAPATTATPETGTLAAVGAYTGNHVLHGFFGQTNTRLAGASGGRFHGESDQAYGAFISGRRAALRLARPTAGDQIPPPERLDLHNYGEVTVDDANDVWMCVETGSPGVWRRLAGRQTAGSLVPITPVRVFDSRISAIPGSGRFAPGESRVLRVTDAYDNAGVKVTENVMPLGATAVVVNVTAAGHTEGNYLTVVPGDVTTTTTATVNWPNGGAAVGNATTVGLDSSRRVNVINGPLGSTHVTLDVTGYYR